MSERITASARIDLGEVADVEVHVSAVYPPAPTDLAEGDDPKEAHAAVIRTAAGALLKAATEGAREVLRIDRTLGR